MKPANIMEKHDAHIHTFTAHMMNKVLGGKSIYEHKKEHIERQHKVEREWAEKYPQINDRVLFRSVDKDGNIYDGYGYVVQVHVHDFSTGYALYKVQIENDVDTYQLYSNFPGNENREWVIRAEHEVNYSE